MTGALTKSQLQGYGWAICDGTTPASQGISDATITTPDLRERFLRHWQMKQLVELGWK